MGKMNKSWHEAHPMGKSLSIERRIEWHLEHQSECGCREMPAKIVEELKRRGGPQ